MMKIATIVDGKMRAR